MSFPTTPTLPTRQANKVALDPVVIAEQLRASGRPCREHNLTTAGKVRPFFGGYRSAESETALRTYFADEHGTCYMPRHIQESSHLLGGHRIQVHLQSFAK